MVPQNTTTKWRDSATYVHTWQIHCVAHRITQARNPPPFAHLFLITNLFSLGVGFDKDQRTNIKKAHA